MLLPRRRFSPLRSIGVRIGIALGCLIITALLVYTERADYRDVNGDSISLLDAFYYATVSLSTTGYGDITPAGDLARAMNVLVITPLRFVFLIVLVGTTVEVLTARTRDDLRTGRWRRKVHDHTVVIGFGVKGRTAVRTLLDSGIGPTQLVVVAPDPEAVAEANRLGLAAVLGDARRDDILRDAGTASARRIIVATDEDDTSVLVTLNARRLAPNAMIVAAARESINADVLRQSGADNVITTAESAGRLLGMSLLSPTAGNLMEDLLDAGRGLEVIERSITREELGIAPSDLEKHGEIVLAVIRGDIVHRFDTGTVSVFQRDDRVVVIRHSLEA